MNATNKINKQQKKRRERFDNKKALFYLFTLLENFHNQHKKALCKYLVQKRESDNLYRLTQNI
jgi:hypothetical protein